MIMNYVRNQWDRVGAWVCVVAGAIALVAGYVGVSGTLDTGEQLPYVISGGMGGLFLLGLGALLWVSADLRDEWRKLDAIDRHLVDTNRLPPPSPIMSDDGIRRSNGRSARPIAAADPVQDGARSGSQQVTPAR